MFKAKLLDCLGCFQELIERHNQNQNIAYMCNRVDSIRDMIESFDDCMTYSDVSEARKLFDELFSSHSVFNEPFIHDKQDSLLFQKLVEEINDLLSSGILREVMSDFKNYVTQENFNRLADVLLDYPFITAVVPPKEENLSFAFLGHTTDEGKTFFQIFTSDDLFLTFYDNEDYYRSEINLLQFGDAILNNEEVCGILINPGVDDFFITRDEFGAIKSYRESVLHIGEQVFIGLPAKDPVELKNALVSFFETEQSVIKAYLLWMARGEGGQNLSHVLIIDSSDDSDTLFPKIAQALEGVDTDGAPVDMMPCEGSAAQWVQDYEPFFER